MKKKTGRPKKELSKRECRSSIGFTKSEFFIVRGKASNSGRHLATYIRDMAIHGKIRARFSEEQWRLVRQLVAMSNDLHQTARTADQEGALKAILHFEAYRDRIDEILIRLKNAN